MCAASTCRRPGVVWLVKGDVRLRLCEKHAGAYRGLGYVEEAE